ncbi:hypothetical protein ACQKOE_15890 [Novosphingobium sp. NPDC080210]|uniref:hypothetical protein n=1 Tax=Novosphingobium sp. NPDC080210 TaxID=3390596 RepID=UPI003D05D631
MILQALDTIHVSSVSSENITTGQTFEVDDQAGRSLIERGLAIEVDAAAAAKTEPAVKAEPEAAEQTPIANKAGASVRTKAA